MKKNADTEVSFCEFKSAKARTRRPNASAFYKHRQDFSWKGVRDEPYKQKATTGRNHERVLSAPMERRRSSMSGTLRYRGRQQQFERH